ncbi:rod shape-determining protein MreC [Granulicella arctica]|uniref:rod shape-determining protein MreC n=1 Tax=Granulicella arctica TaxID=940613 RepID=UPI0021DFD282|nr:rod shape-determining protein MreC [Granulicella arctica]
MESFFSRFKNALVLIVILLVQTIGLAIQVRRPVGADEPDGRKVYLLRYWATTSISPFERLIQRFGSGVEGVWTNYLDLRHTRRQNAELQQQIAQMRLEEAAFAEDAIQGHRLQVMLDFQQHYVAKTVAAQVIGTSGSDQSRMLIIDKGSEEGLKPDMAVITPDGIVGKLRDVFAHTAQLLLLNDQSSGAGVVLQTTRIRAVVRGTPTGKLQIGNLTADSRIKPGETILTSGGDLVYPRGLNVGTVESVAADPDHQPYTAIVIKPSANLFQLEEVLVIMQTQTNIPLRAQQDLARGAATAEGIAAQADTRRAADLLSERLPSLHDVDPKYVEPSGADAKSLDPAAASAVGATNKEAGGTVPKPLPTLHSDHFTPGTTPPASSLTPGAPASAVPLEVPTPTPRKTPRVAAPPAETPPPTTEPPQ